MLRYCSVSLQRINVFFNLLFTEFLESLDHSKMQRPFPYHRNSSYEASHLCGQNSSSLGNLELIIVKTKLLLCLLRATLENSLILTQGK